jgi:integral membrane protein (TIGR01906 family)
MILLIQIVLIFSLPVLLLLTNVELATFDLEFFEMKYEEFNIMEATGIEKQDLMEITNGLLDYLRGKRDNIVIYAKVHGEMEQIFENREIAHLVDVRVLYKKGFILRNMLMLICILSVGCLFLFNRGKLRKTLVIAASMPMILIGIFYLLLITDFNKYFTYFHLVLFDNDLWLLNPETDILIQMYPLDFFYSIALKIINMFLIQLSIILFITLLIPKVKALIVKKFR